MPTYVRVLVAAPRRAARLHSKAIFVFRVPEHRGLLIERLRAEIRRASPSYRIPYVATGTETSAPFRRRREPLSGTASTLNCHPFLLFRRPLKYHRDKWANDHVRTGCGYSRRDFRSGTGRTNGQTNLRPPKILHRSIETWVKLIVAFLRNTKVDPRK